MPIEIADLVRPISSDQPAGADMRYAPAMDDLREARRREDDVAQGVWKREVKEPDYARVIKLAKDALTKKSKDLQIAGWLTEALLAREGFPGLKQGLALIQNLLEEFWDTVWPTADEDGDLEMRAAPLRWVATQLTVAVRSIAITQTGVSWLRYQDSRGIPTEEDAAMSMEKAEARREATEDGRLMPEAWNEALGATGIPFLQKLCADANAAMETQASLSSLCDERFPDDPPDFGPLRTAIEDVAQTARILLIGKGGRPLGEEPEPEPEPEPQFVEAAPEPQYVEAAATGAAAAARMARAPRAAGGIEPADAEDAYQRIIAAAHFLRRANIQNPVPYLILRALRWGEIRNAGGYAQPDLAEAPPSQTRVDLKRLFSEYNWDETINAAENAMAMPCGRAWLDLQRYVVRACRNQGYENVANAIVAELKALVADYPQLPKWSMADDTAAANTETQEWMQEERVQAPPVQPQMAAPPPEPVYEFPRAVPPTMDGEAPKEPEALQLALAAAQSGRLDEALEIMARETRQAPSGRDRFLRRVELAQICLAAGRTAIAAPVLEELAKEITERNLEDWETAETVAQPLTLLYRCLATRGDDAARKAIYEQVCRLDPVRALTLGE